MVGYDADGTGVGHLRLWGLGVRSLGHWSDRERALLLAGGAVAAAAAKSGTRGSKKRCLSRGILVSETRRPPPYPHFCYGCNRKYDFSNRHTVYPETLQRRDFTSFAQPQV